MGGPVTYRAAFGGPGRGDVCSRPLELCNGYDGGGFTALVPAGVSF